MKLIAALGLSLTLLLAGCGGSSSEGETLDGDTSSDTSTGGEAKVYDESAVVEQLGLVDDGTGTDSYVFTTPDGVECPIAVVLTSFNEVSMYQDAGDNVASNLPGTAGVKIVADEAATCRDAISDALIDFE